MESLSRQCPEDGFASLDDYARYHYANFGIDPEIIHDALLMGLSDTGFEWSEQYKEYVGKVIGVRKRRARMERIILCDQKHRPYGDEYRNFGWLFREQVALDHHGRECEAITPADGVVFTFLSQERSRAALIMHPRDAKDVIEITAIEGFEGPRWQSELGHKGYMYLSMAGHYTLTIYDPWA